MEKEAMPNEERARYLNKLSENFSKHYFIETAKKINYLSQLVLARSENSSKFSKEIEELMNTFGREYIADDQLSVYRRNCLVSFYSVIMDLWEQRGYAELTRIINDTTPELKKTVHSISAMNEIYQVGVDSNEKCRYHLACYMYLIMLEGLFDEFIWLLYSCKKGLEGLTIDYKNLKEKKLQWFKLQLEPVFFEGYNDRVRNAIAHANFSYNEETRKMTFFDYADTSGKKKRAAFEESLTIEEFSLRYFEKVYSIFLLRFYVVNLITVSEILVKEKPFDRITMP